MECLLYSIASPSSKLMKTVFFWTLKELANHVFAIWTLALALTAGSVVSTLYYTLIRSQIVES